MHSAMAVSASSSVCGINSAVLVRGDAPARLWTSSVKCVALPGRSRLGIKYREVGVARRRVSRRVLASAADDGSSTDSKEKSTKTEESIPAWAQPGTDELPPWAKSERPQTQEAAQDLPFAVYLIGSCLVAIAAVGSVFEYFNKNPVFGVVQPDSPLWAPILGFFAFTGLPTSDPGLVCEMTTCIYPISVMGFLFYKGVQLANKASEDIDREDGFLGR